MVSIRLAGPMCTERDNQMSWMDAGTLNRQLSPPPGMCGMESHDKAKRVEKRIHTLKKAKLPVPVPMTAAGFLKEVKTFEGIVPHMYRDSKGLVTVGIGFLIETPNGQITDKGLKMPFMNVSTRAIATQEEVQAEFDAVKKQPYLNKKGLPLSASSFRTSLLLDSAFIDKRFDELVTDYWKQLRIEFGASFESKYPISVQYALLDMIFNLGRGKDVLNKDGVLVKRTGIHQYQKLREALNKADWKRAGDISLRHGIGKDRNDRINQWFHEGGSTVFPPPLVPSH